jgi:hypothetical protein
LQERGGEMPLGWVQGGQGGVLGHGLLPVEQQGEVFSGATPQVHGDAEGLFGGGADPVPGIHRVHRVEPAIQITQPVHGPVGASQRRP